MGGGIKSKFKFPIPGRSSKKHETPAVPLSGSMSKAQRILGADGINIGSSRLVVNAGRSWEAGSTGAISIAISESSASQPAQDAGPEQEDGGRSLWEEESAIIPRQIRSAHGSSLQGITKKRSTFAIGNESRDNVTSMSPKGRRQSSSTIDTHYDPHRMPLRISQQTSNSAMAKGLPTKMNEHMDADPTLGSLDYGTKDKKKPARLDFSRLRPKASRERNRDIPKAEPNPHTLYTLPSSSFVSQASKSLLSQKSPRRLLKQPPTVQQPQPPKAMNQHAGLQQLYQHYEQMSFHDEDGFDDEYDQEQDASANVEDRGNKVRPISTFAHSLIAPLSGEHELIWDNHSRESSHDSRMASSPGEAPGGLQVHASTRKEYAGSVSSRHTRTSKAASCKSLVESDRLQNSVLSLSDSSDDETTETGPSTAPSRQGVMHDSASPHSNQGRTQHSSGYQHAAMGSRKFTPSLNQVEEHLAVRVTSKTQTGRSPSHNMIRSSDSSMNTLIMANMSSSAPNVRLSSETAESLESFHSPGYGIQQAMTVSFVPLASTAQAATKVSISGDTHQFDQVLFRQNSTATSRFSHSSEQPTPPLSPNSVEFYVKSRDSLQRDAMVGGSSEAYNARLMAVTRQEEMLLAALRQKRAMMRDTTISEAEDENGRTSRSSGGSFGGTNKAHKNSHKISAKKQVTPERAATSTPTDWPLKNSVPSAASSPLNGMRGANRRGNSPKGRRRANSPSTTGRGDATNPNSKSANRSSTSTTFGSRDDQILMYFDRPPLPTANTADAELYFSDDYMEDSDGEDLIVNERRSSRMQHRRDSASAAVARGGERSGSVSSQGGSSSGGYRKNSFPMNTFNPPTKGQRLQDVPEVHFPSEYNEDVDADDSDDSEAGEGLDQFPQPPPSWPLPPRPSNKPAPTSTSTPTRSPASNPAASPDNLLHPSSAARRQQQRNRGNLSPKSQPRSMKSNRSMVRLSAVGPPMSSPMLAWGDDD